MPFVSTGKINYSGFSDKSVLESMMGGGSETPSAKSRYVFVGNDYKQYVTSDFSEWTTIDAHTDKQLGWGCYSKDHDLFVFRSGVKAAGPYWSSDLTTVEQATIDTEDTFDYYITPNYVSECQLFCATNFTNPRNLCPILTSKDGKNWTVHSDDSARSTSTNTNFAYMEHLNRIVSVAYNTGDIVYSDDQGESWIKTTISNKFPISKGSNYPLCYNKDDQLIYGFDASSVYQKLMVLKSADGLVWEDFITIPTTSNSDNLIFQQYIPEAGKVFFASINAVGTYSNDGTYHFVGKTEINMSQAAYDPVAKKLIYVGSNSSTGFNDIYAIDYADMLDETYTDVGSAPTLQPVYQIPRSGGPSGFNGVIVA